MEQRINNALLMPDIVPDDKVSVDENGTPDYISNLIFMQIRPLTATKEGTFESLTKVLDHCAEMGVNALWVSPIYDPGSLGNGYSNLGPHTVDPRLSGTDDYELGWLEVKKFVDKAHEMNIRIILDIITWGTVKGSELHRLHPSWYTGKDEYDGDAFDWTNKEFDEWYINTAVNIVLKTGCDGLRYDVEPKYAGYDICREIRQRLLALGRKPLMMSEHGNERLGAFDCEQIGISGSIHGFYEQVPEYYFLDILNLVDSIKTGNKIGSDQSQETGLCGTYRYYVNTITCHDHYYPVVCGNRLALGYQAIFAPFIPLWYIGEEWNNPRQEDLDANGIVLYFNKIDWECLEKQENRIFYEDVKKMIRVRREHPDVFNYFAKSTRQANICKVESTGGNLQSYARFIDEKALVVVPNYNKDNQCGEVSVKLCFSDLHLNAKKEYAVKDAFTGEIITSASDGTQITLHIPYADLSVLLIQ